MLGAFPSLSPWKNLGQAGMSVSWFSSPARPVSIGAPPWLAAASDSECATPRGIPWIHWMIQAPGLQNHQVLVVLNDLSHPPCWNSLWTAVPLTLSSQPSWSGPKLGAEGAEDATPTVPCCESCGRCLEAKHLQNTRENRDMNGK